MAPEQLTSIISKALSGLPLPAHDEQHLCPCFEQIVGAAYGVIVAERYGIRTRSLKNYHDDVRLRLPSLLASEQVPPPATTGPLATWASGFYFNNALQRIVWSGDRLLVAFARLPASCCPAAPQVVADNSDIGLSALLKDAKARLDHEHLSGSSGVRAYYELLDVRSFNPEEDDVTDKNYLRALRYDVNEAKHSIGGFRRKSAGKGTRGPWASLEQDKQFYYVATAFLAVGNLYREMHRVYFVDKLLLPRAG